MADGREAMKAWTLVDELVVEIHAMTRRTPDDRFEDLAAALRAVGVRTALKIVQGLNAQASERPEAFRSALSLLAEMRYHLYLSRRLGLIDLRRYKSVCLKHERAQKCLRDLLSLSRVPAESNGSPAGPAGQPERDPMEAGYERLEGAGAVLEPG
jgi:four helix bundle protein